MASRDITGLRTRLLRFYRAHRRDLPWRRTRDPYAIWVSEIMLQQTQVDTVRPRYSAFLERYPTVQALAGAGEQEVCEAWAGLGYYRRARMLHAAAVQVVGAHKGTLPRDVATLRTLPGVGRYTAGAIASIAFGVAAPLVDGNVARVLSRIFALEDPPLSGAGQRALWQLAEELVQGEAPGDLNQALMELGATLCAPKAPRCSVCPVRSLCRGHASGAPTRLPVSPPAAPRRRLAVAFAWLEGERGLWLERRPLEGLWAGLWELPSAEGRRAKLALAERLGGAVLIPLARVRHELSHRDVDARVYRVRGAWTPPTDRTLRSHADPLSAPLSALAKKAILAATHSLRRDRAESS